jgi:hypothetical protein
LVSDELKKAVGEQKCCSRRSRRFAYGCLGFDTGLRMQRMIENKVYERNGLPVETAEWHEKKIG